MILRSTDVGAALRSRRSRQRGFFALPGGMGAMRPGGSSAPPPTFVSAQASGLGSVSNGDRVILFLLAAGVGAPSAPTGWTRIVNTSEANGYALAVYKSLYSGSNAPADATNFPVSNGYFQTIVYAGAVDVLQIGALTDGIGGSLTVTALTNPTAASSVLMSWYSSRDPGTTMTSSEGMTNRLTAAAYSFFDSSLWEQSGVQSGSRSFFRTSSSFNQIGFNFEVG